MQRMLVKIILSISVAEPIGQAYSRQAGLHSSARRLTWAGIRAGRACYPLGIQSPFYL